MIAVGDEVRAPNSKHVWRVRVIMAGYAVIVRRARNGLVKDYHRVGDLVKA